MRIGRELGAAKQQLIDAEVRVEQIEATLDEALKLAKDSSRAYRVADDLTRRQWNQALFTKIFVRDAEVVGAELTDNYGALLREEPVEKLETLKARKAEKPSAKLPTLPSWGSIEGLLVETAGETSA